MTTTTETIMVLAEGWLLTTEPKEYDEARAALLAAVEKLEAENARLVNQNNVVAKACLEAEADLGEWWEERDTLRAELDAAKADAQKWRDYKARKDAVIAAGMGRNPLRDEATK